MNTEEYEYKERINWIWEVYEEFLKKFQQSNPDLPADACILAAAELTSAFFQRESR